MIIETLEKSRSLITIPISLENKVLHSMVTPQQVKVWNENRRPVKSICGWKSLHVTTCVYNKSWKYDCKYLPTDKKVEVDFIVGDFVSSILLRLNPLLQEVLLLVLLVSKYENHPRDLIVRVLKT